MSEHFSCIHNYARPSLLHFLFVVYHDDIAALFMAGMGVSPFRCVPIAGHSGVVRVRHFAASFELNAECVQLLGGR